MKLKKEFITYDMDDKQVMVSTDTKLFSGMIRFNATGAYIIEYLKTETTKEEIVESMMKKFDADKEVISRDVQNVINQLISIGALNV